MKKQLVTMLLVAAMTGTMVTGCGSSAASDVAPETGNEVE